MKKSSFQYRMKYSIENGFFILSPSLAAEKQGPGLKFSSENENFKPRMKISSENGSFVRGGMFFFRSSENEIFRSRGPLSELWRRLQQIFFTFSELAAEHPDPNDAQNEEESSTDDDDESGAGPGLKAWRLRWAKSCDSYRRIANR